jgi:hypothetical protein
MADDRQDQHTEDITEAAAPATDELEDLAPLEDESDAVTGGNGSPLGWDRVRNIEPGA